MTYIAERSTRFYVVAYDGLDPLTGQPRMPDAVRHIPLARQVSSLSIWLTRIARACFSWAKRRAPRISAI